MHSYHESALIGMAAVLLRLVTIRTETLVLGSHYDAGTVSITSVVSVTGKYIFSLVKLYS